MSPFLVCSSLTSSVYYYYFSLIQEFSILSLDYISQVFRDQMPQFIQNGKNLCRKSNIILMYPFVIRKVNCSKPQGTFGCPFSVLV